MAKVNQDYKPRTYVVVWTTKRQNKFTDHSEFYDKEEKQIAEGLFSNLLKQKNTYCVAFCKILKDSE